MYDNTINGIYLDGFSQTTLISNGLVAQRLEQQPFKLMVGGSNPLWFTSGLFEITPLYWRGGNYKIDRYYI